MYRAKIDKDKGVFKAPKVSDTTEYELIQEHFVDSSGFGTRGELALTAGDFLDRVKQGLYYGITGVGQFQVYIGEYKKIARKKSLKDKGLLSSKKIMNNTRENITLDNTREVKHWNTKILTFTPNGTVIIDNGGFYSATTKKRLNKYLKPYNISVYQKKYNWYIDYKGQIIDYFNGIELKI